MSPACEYWTYRSPADNSPHCLLTIPLEVLSSLKGVRLGPFCESLPGVSTSMAVEENMTKNQSQEAMATGIDQPKYPLMGLTPRTLIISVVLCILASFWINQTEVITHACQITEAVPTIPAVAALLLLVLMNPIVRRISKSLSLDRREIIMVYVFMTVATTITGAGIGRFFLNTLPVLYYFDTPENNFASLQNDLPSWMVPHDREVVRKLYEASETGAVPWAAWAQPLLMWGIFFLAVWIVMLSLSTIFRRQWSEKEKLTYPLLHLPLECTDGVDGKQLIGGFLKNKLMWAGFILAAAYNFGNIANAYNPAITALGKSYNLGGLFTEQPFSYLQPMAIHYRPELLGFGYLVPTEIAFSVFAFYVLMKLENLCVQGAGVQISGYPFWQERGLGAYIATFFLLAYIGRNHIASILRKAFTNDPTIDDSDEPMSYRVAIFGGAAAFAIVLAWMTMAGMALWLAVLYMVLVLMLAVVYARIRAEVGVPLIWMFPYYQAFKGITYFLGTDVLRYQNSTASATVFATFVFMSRGYYSAMMGSQVEGYRLARATGVRQKSMNWVLIAALIVGFTVSMTGLLKAYYNYGAGGLSGMSDWGSSFAMNEYQAVADMAKGSIGPDMPRIIATGSGFGIAIALMILRMLFLRFPLHPLAFCMVTAYGELIWGPFALVWIIKSAIFKLGGMKAYKQLIPFFIGLALGHYFAAGIVWSIFATLNPEAVRRYGVWFG